MNKVLSPGSRAKSAFFDVVNENSVMNGPLDVDRERQFEIYHGMHSLSWKTMFARSEFNENKWAILEGVKAQYYSHCCGLTEDV